MRKGMSNYLREFRKEGEKHANIKNEKNGKRICQDNRCFKWKKGKRVMLIYKNNLKSNYNKGLLWKKKFYGKIKG